MMNNEIQRHPRRLWRVSFNFRSALAAFQKLRVVAAGILVSLSAATAMIALARGQSTTPGTPSPSWSGPVPRAAVLHERTEHVMAYDEARGQIVLFGGFWCDPMCVPHNETWTWDGSVWIQQQPVTSPPARLNTMMVYDAARKKVVLFGGSNVFYVFGDTWTWDGSNWTEEKPEASPPFPSRNTIS